MNLRLKFLTFLGFFLLGSFLIVTWKSFNIFSQKYSMAMGQAELQKLEVQAHSIAQRFQNFPSVLSENTKVEAQLKGLGVQLLAHVIKEDGKWKAQWFEGQAGARQAAQGATQQIPFETLSTTRKSWHLINSKELGSSLAYVIPALSQEKASFYVFFLTKDFFAHQFMGQRQQESLALVSPFLGEIYTTGLNPGFPEALEKYKKSMMDNQSGVIAAGSRSLVYLFNPDLQLYLVKSKKVGELTVDKPVYLLTLGLIMLILIGLALFAQDLLLRKAVFEEVEKTVDEVFASHETSGVESQKAPEMPHVAAPAAKTAESLAPSSQETNHERLLAQLRPKAINSLGYLNKLKQTSAASPHLILLETELRELRRLIDPAGISDLASLSPTPAAKSEEKLEEKPVRPQPAFNPFLKENFLKEIPQAEAPANEAANADSGIVIRKPKRESHEFRKL